jgi:NADH-ubiquinone oxidoreductase chain 5
MFFLGRFFWDFFSFFVFSVFCFLVLLGAITKRAQLPFRAWLPAAIAAPTPVSSLVHSSTLVTAGVYVLIRFFYIFEVFRSFTFFLLLILTMVLAGWVASFEIDFKKVVAMSTLRQLGFMLFVLSLGRWVLCYVHIVIHAFFKRMLFMSTGSLIRQIRGNQDSRFYGGRIYSVSSFLFFLVSCFCLRGFPFFVGFYSKDFVICFCSFYERILLYYLFLIGCFFTVFYSFRVVFVSYFSFLKDLPFFIKTERGAFVIPLSFLFYKCCFLGGLFYWMFISRINFFVCCFDLIFGSILLFFGVGGFYFIKFFYGLCISLGSLFFFRWVSSSGTSFSFDYQLFFNFEVSWLESLGGKGVYRALFFRKRWVYRISLVGVGWLFLVLLFWGTICF